MKHMVLNVATHRFFIQALPPSMKNIDRGNKPGKMRERKKRGQKKQNNDGNSSH